MLGSVVLQLAAATIVRHHKDNCIEIAAQLRSKCAPPIMRTLPTTECEHCVLREVYQLQISPAYTPLGVTQCWTKLLDKKMSEKCSEFPNCGKKARAAAMKSHFGAPATLAEGLTCVYKVDAYVQERLFGYVCYGRHKFSHCFGFSHCDGNAALHAYYDCGGTSLDGSAKACQKCIITKLQEKYLGWERTCWDKQAQKICSLPAAARCHVQFAHSECSKQRKQAGCVPCFKKEAAALKPAKTDLIPPVELRKCAAEFWNYCHGQFN